MIIRCSPQFLEEIKNNNRHFEERYLGNKDSSEKEVDPLFIWHAKLFYTNHRKAIVLVNDSNRFTIVMYGFTIETYHIFDVRVMEAITSTFQRMLLSEELIDKYIKDYEEVYYDDEKDQQANAWLEESVENAMIHFRPDIDKNMFRTQSGGLAVSYCEVESSSGNGKYFIPAETMAKELSAKYNLPAYDNKAVKLMVSLRVGNNQVERELIVPTYISFTDLHRILQVTFEWQDKHRFSFDFDNVEFRSIRIINYKDEMSNEEYNSMAREITQDLGKEYKGDIRYYNLQADYTLVSTYIYDYEKFSYTYDLRKNWKHTIEIIEYIDNCTEIQPLCVSGSGDFNIEDINRRLKKVMADYVE